MITRRGLLIGGGVVLALPRPLSAARPTFPKDGLFHWWNPRADPFIEKFQVAFDAFAKEGVSKEVLGRLWEQQAYAKARIRPGEPYDYMMSGRGAIHRKVVAETDFWPEHVSRVMWVYTVFEGDMIHELGLPEVCGNWTIRSYKFGTQPVCVPCVECKKT